MQKYRIMIVDDEADVREGIVRHIDWESLGFEIVAEAENGRDALDKAENTEMDVVLTDIKMPFIDGLQLSAELTKMYPGIQIIILSGFDEFEYAQEAIKLNVAEYILKPVNVAELTAILLRVKQLLDENIEQSRNIELLQKSFQNSLPLMRERFLIELIWGMVPKDDIERQLAQYDLNIDQSPYKVVSIFALDFAAEEFPTISAELVPLSIKQIVEEEFEELCQSYTFLGTSTIISITSWNDSNPVEKLMNLANEICLKCYRVLNIRITVGIGRVYEKISRVHDSYLEAKSALEYQAVWGTGKVIYIQDMEQNRSKAVFSQGGEERLLAAIKFGTADQIAQQLEKNFTQMDSLQDWEKNAYLIGLFNAMYQIVQQYSLHTEETVMEKLRLFFDIPQEWGNRDYMYAWFLDICQSMHQLLSSKRKTAAYHLTEEAKRIISERYSDSSLSVEQVCDHLHVSQSHFSTVFKQKTGTSFIQYLTEVRMNQAAELLKTTDEKTYMIANNVGYEDPNYFSYVFKKRFGISPTKYRKNE